MPSYSIEALLRNASPLSTDTQRDLLNDPLYAPEFASNPYLDPAVCLEVAMTGKDIKVGVSLVSRFLPQELREQLWAAPKVNAAVLTGAVKANLTYLVDSEVDQILARKKLPAGLVAVLLDRYSSRPDWVANLVPRVSTAAAVKWLTDNALYHPDIELVREQVARAAAADKISRGRKDPWVALLDAHPGLLVDFVASKQTPLIRAVAGSEKIAGHEDLQRQILGLTSTCEHSEPDPWAMVAAVANPMVSVDLILEVQATLTAQRSTVELLENMVRRLNDNPITVGSLDAESSPQAIGWLLKRALPNNYQAGRRGQWAGLLTNPHLNPDQRYRLLSTANAQDGTLDGLPPQCLTALQEAATLALGRDLPPAPAQRISVGELSDGILTMVAKAQEWVANRGPEVEPDPERNHSREIDRERAAELPAGQFIYRNELVTYLSEEVGSSPEGWRMLLSVIEDFPGTAAQLVALTKRVSALS